MGLKEQLSELVKDSYTEGSIDTVELLIESFSKMQDGGVNTLTIKQVIDYLNESIEAIR